MASEAISDTAQMVQLLGSPRALRDVADRLDRLMAHVRRGLPSSTVDAMAMNIGVQRSVIADVVNVSIRTLTRRRNGVLDSAASDRLLRLARIVALATRVLGTREKAAGWMRAPSRALGGKAPIDLVDTDIGTQQVQAVLERVAHGVFS